MNEHLDERDREIYERRIAYRPSTLEIRIGDFIVLENGQYARAAHDWGTTIQPDWPPSSGSYYLGDGYAQHSGGLEPGIPRAHLKLTQEIRTGRFWFFHHDYSAAHNAVEVQAPCRVYRYEQDARI